MDNNDLIEQAGRIISNKGKVGPNQTYAEALEFIRIYAGEKSALYKDLLKRDKDYTDKYHSEKAVEFLRAFINQIENGIVGDISVERKAQLDVVSDFLEQAQNLLQTRGIHPAAPTVLIGASLEEFLRNWIEDTDLKLGNRKPSLENYGSLLRENNLITKQDKKDITSWGGLRNDAAHGNWDEVDDKNKISLMLQGVNLFMRRYTE